MDVFRLMMMVMMKHYTLLGTSVSSDASYFGFNIDNRGSYDLPVMFRGPSPDLENERGGFQSVRV